MKPLSRMRFVHASALLCVASLCVTTVATGSGPRGLLASGRTVSGSSEVFAPVASVAVPQTATAPKRSIACSVEATFSVPVAGTVSARLEYSLLDGDSWRSPQSVPLAVSSVEGSGTSRGHVAFPLAGTWRMRQALIWEGGAGNSSWVTLKVAPYRPRGRVVVVVFGDSMAGMPAIALKRLLKGTAASVVVDYKSSSGMSRPDFFNWPARVTAQKRRLHPDVVVMMFGANDWQNMRSGGHIYTRGTRAWDALYSRRVGRIMDIARAGDTIVYVVGQPISGRSRGYALHMSHINALAHREARKRSDVRFVSTWSLFATPAGKYSSSLRTTSGNLVRMRSGDKIHFTGAGALRLAASMRATVQADWRRFN